MVLEIKILFVFVRHGGVYLLSQHLGDKEEVLYEFEAT